MRSLVTRTGRRVAAAVLGLVRDVDYPVDTDDWLALCGAPQALWGPHDWGLALAHASADDVHGHSVQARGLGALLGTFAATGDQGAGETLAVLAARFAEHLDLAAHFDRACTLPPDFHSGAGDPAGRLFAWPGVNFPLAVEPDLLAWRMAAGLRAPRGETALTASAPLNRRRILITCACFEPERVGGAVHALRAAGAARVGVLALVALEERP